MADRSYGIQPGTSLTDGRSRRSASPAKYLPQQQSQDWTNTAPPPPAHSTVPYSQTLHTELPPHPPPYETSDVSSYNPQDSSFRALQGVDNLYNAPPRTPSPERTLDQRPYQPYQARPTHQYHSSEHSIAPLMANRSDPQYLPSPSNYGDSRVSPINQRSSYFNTDGYEIDPRNIEDDGDDGFENPPPRNGRLGGGAAGAAAGMFGGIASRDASGHYNALPANSSNANIPEKSEWLEKQSGGNKRLKRFLWVGGAILLVAVIAGAIVGGVLASKSKSGSGSSSSSSTTSAGSHNTGGLYDINSAEVQKLLNNKDLHKVFPAMDYTPLNAQYPDCLSNMPDQNNVTLDIAMLSQLSPAVRLYGTDCNQTEMVLTAIDRLQMNNSMSVWLGVWLGTNTTTNDRQLAQMYQILDKYPTSHFAGVIVGNEVLFRKDLTLTQLGNTLTQVRSNLTAKSIKLPVATSDLGDNWTAGLAAVSDIVMANVHPFFAGVKPDVAPGWTYNFWQEHDSSLAVASSGTWPKSIISEVGWPSDGGNDCGTDSGTCASGQGAVASIDNMNTFMNGFVCQSMANATTYFWFEAFDEPWKVIFNTATDQWESKWGLMDSDRNLKSGIKIPDCSGKTLSKPY